MYTLILTLIVLGSQPQAPKAEASVTSVSGYASEDECKAAGKAWANKRELRSIDENTWTARKSFVCSKASAQ